MDVPFGWIDIYASTDATIPVQKIDYSFYLDKKVADRLKIKKLSPALFNVLKFINGVRVSLMKK